MNRALPGRPTRHEMVRAAILMEQSGFDWNEWATMDKICKSSKSIRDYILSYAKDVIDMFEGLEPTKGRFSYEIAFIAASHAQKSAYKQMGSVPKERITALLEPPAPWTDEEYEKAWKAYCQRHPGTPKITAKLKEALERETHIVRNEPYTTSEGCKIIPIFAGGKTAVEKRAGL